MSANVEAVESNIQFSTQQLNHRPLTNHTSIGVMEAAQPASAHETF